MKGSISPRSARAWKTAGTDMPKRALLTSGEHHFTIFAIGIYESHVRSPALRFVLNLPALNLTESLIYYHSKEFESITEGLSDTLNLSQTIGIDSGRDSEF
jgi:hypothetical protein